MHFNQVHDNLTYLSFGKTEKPQIGYVNETVINRGVCYPIVFPVLQSEFTKFCKIIVIHTGLYEHVIST